MRFALGADGRDILCRATLNAVGKRLSLFLTFFHTLVPPWRFGAGTAIL
jgi:hypothetical protein